MLPIKPEMLRPLPRATERVENQDSQPGRYHRHFCSRSKVHLQWSKCPAPSPADPVTLNHYSANKLHNKLHLEARRKLLLFLQFGPPNCKQCSSEALLMQSHPFLKNCPGSISHKTENIYHVALHKKICYSLCFYFYLLTCLFGYGN